MNGVHSVVFFHVAGLLSGNTAAGRPLLRVVSAGTLSDDLIGYVA
jgi:hypothetical protein